MFINVQWLLQSVLLQTMHTLALQECITNALLERVSGSRNHEAKNSWELSFHSLLHFESRNHF